MTAPYGLPDVEAGAPTPFHAKDREPLALRWAQLSFEVETDKGETKQILKNLSGKFSPGELTAIMGPSGAGKSTFMNVLAGRAPYGKATGTITVNGEPLDMRMYRKQLAYVMQQDALFATQTPRECLRFTAALRLPEKTEQEREELVEGAIAALNLTRCADTMIGSTMMPGLSGGEKKRTAVAVELISSPSLIFLDEPTSGLDSHSAFELVKILRGLAETGCTIVCTIHQPSSEVFDLFHRVNFLRYGQVVYNGPVDGIVGHFAAQGHHCKPNYNPADFAMHKLQTLTDDEIAPLIAAVTPMKGGSEIDGMNAEGSGNWDSRSAGFCTQLMLLGKREAFQIMRDTPTLAARFGMGLILALMVGIVFFDAGNKWGDASTGVDTFQEVNNHWGAVFFFSMNVMFLAAQPMLLVFPLERAVFIREYTAGTYGTAAYFIAKTVVELPAAVLQQVLALVVCYFMVDLQGSFAIMLLGLTLLACVSASTALLLGTLTTRAETAVNLAPVLYIPQVLFSGFLISIDAIPEFLQWIQWICPLKYSISLIAIGEFSETYLPDNNTFARNTTADLINNASINRDDLHIYVIIMAALYLAFRILAAIVLSNRSKQFQ